MEIGEQSTRRLQPFHLLSSDNDTCLSWNCDYRLHEAKKNAIFLKFKQIKQINILTFSQNTPFWYFSPRHRSFTNRYANARREQPHSWPRWRMCCQKRQLVRLCGYKNQICILANRWYVCMHAWRMESVCQVLWLDILFSLLNIAFNNRMEINNAFLFFYCITCNCYINLYLI